jgi:hypothetical protein
MRNPDEYEAAFYADTTNANLDITVKVGNHLLNSNEPGDPDTEVSARGDCNNGGRRSVSRRLRKQICRALPVA